MPEPFSPDVMFPRITLPEIPKIEIKDYKLADTFYDRLRQHIEGTQNQLKKDEQLVLYYYNQTGERILVTDMGYHNPNLIILYGQDSNGNECSVIAHMQSVQLVVKILKLENKAERRTIGFLNKG